MVQLPSFFYVIPFEAKIPMYIGILADKG